MSTPNPIATTGTFNFAPAFGETVLYIYGLCGVRRTALTQQHFDDARLAANMLMARWSADGVNLWQVDLQTVPLVQGTATYSVPYNTIVMLDAYYTIGTAPTATNRIMLPISRTEYASYPNPLMQGACTVYWFDRLLNPTVTLWPVPDGTQASFSYYRLRQAMDTSLSNAQGAELPIYFLEAFVYGMAARLAAIWAPERAAALKLFADEAYGVAARQNIETAQQYISPAVSGYFRA